MEKFYKNFCYKKYFNTLIFKYIFNFVLFNIFSCRCFTAGFGSEIFRGVPVQKQKLVDVKVVNQLRCENLIRQANPTKYANFFLNRKSFLCAGGVEGKDACSVIFKFLFLE